MNSLSNFQIPDVWEVKDVVNKLKNVVLNYTEMEAKVHEATNNEPWGASSTLMQELAQGTYNYQYFNEIMPTVYRRFTEKESKQWRQIYKALVLLEYLIKNGSERVVDDARSHVSMIKVMRNFYYIDDKGKDEGLNVRNRAKEIVELLSSTEKIRAERKSAKKNRNKYIGVGSDGPRSMGYSGSGSGGFSGASAAVGAASRYMGFGSESLGGLGLGGGGGISFNGDAMTLGQPYASQQGSRGGRYDEDDDGLYHSDSNNDSPKANKGFADDDEDDFVSSSSSNQKKKSTQQQTNDGDWGDFAWGGAADEPTTAKRPSVSIDDDFADFQHAVADEPIISTTTTTTAKKQDLFDLLGDDTTTTTATSNTTSPSFQFSGLNSSQPITPSGYHQQQLHQPQAQQQQQKPVEEATSAAASSTPTTGMWAQASNFVSLDSLGKKANNTTPTTGPSMNSLKNTSVQAGWSNWASNNQPQQQQQKPAATNKTNSAFDDLLL